MRVDFSAAGLTDDARHILQVAANLLGAYRMSARLRDWDGTRCDVLFVDALDGYGRRAAESAQRRGIRVVHFGDDPAAVGEDIAHIPSSGPIASVVRHLQHLFTSASGVQSEPAQASNLVQMASSAALGGRDLAFRHGEREVLILRSASRVRAASLSDILYCRDHIDDPAWSIEVLEPAAARSSTHHVAVSLDSFLCQAADCAGGRFPPHAAGRWFLQDWPDLGAATRQVAALRLAQVLRRGPASASDLAATSGLADDVVTRYLWAFRAAGLVLPTASPPTALASVDVPAEIVETGGMLARLARRFGLSWK